MRVLIIDDDLALCRALVALLEEYQCATDVAHDGQMGLQLAETDIYELMIVDVMLPKMTGPQVVRSLRADGCTTPILLLTARDAVDDRASGLDSGADDYLVKPFASAELLARVRALTRRCQRNGQRPQKTVGDFHLDEGEHDAFIRGQRLGLTAKEYQLLELLARHTGQTLLPEQLLDHLWEPGASRRNLETLVHTLRKKMSRLSSQSTVPVSHELVTIRGMGYSLRRR